MILALFIINIDYWLYLDCQKKNGMSSGVLKKKNQFCMVANMGMIHKNIWLQAKY
jgi:hypothetical protein